VRGQPKKNQVSLGSLVDSFSSRREARTEAYYAAGLRPDEVKEWMNANVSPERAVKFIRAGVGPEQAKEQLRKTSKLAQLADIKEWHKKGFPPEQVNDWIQAGFTLEEAEKWRAVLRNPAKIETVARLSGGFIDEDNVIDSLAQWKKHGVENPKEALEELALLANNYNLRNNIQFEAWAKASSLGIPAYIKNTLITDVDRVDKCKDLIRAGVDKEDAAILVNSSPTLSANELLQWRHAYPDISGRDIYALSNSSVSVSQFAPWHKVKIDPQDAVIYINAGIQDPDEVKEWMSIHDPSLKRVARGGAPALQELIQLGVDAKDYGRLLEVRRDKRGSVHANATMAIGALKRGLTIKQLIEWEEKTEASYSGEVIQCFSKAGIEPKDADQWFKSSKTGHYFSTSRNLPEPMLEDIKKLRSEGIDTEAYQKLRAAQKEVMIIQDGKRNSEYANYESLGDSIRHWRERGLSAEDAGAWWPKVASKSSFEDAAAVVEVWKKNGFSPEEAQKWQTSAFTDNLDDLERAYAAKHYQAARLTPRQAASWVNAGFEAGQAAQWRQAGIKRPADATKLAEDGLTPQAAQGIAAYEKEGFTPRQALIWKSNNFSATEAASWTKEGIKEPQVAQTWKEAGITPQKAGQYEKARSA
jgi:hypothetical protein